MMIRMKYNIIRSKKGFREFIKFNLEEARRFIISCEKSPLFYNQHLDEYVEALEIDDIGIKYASILNKDESEALIYYRYHLPIDKEPDKYYDLLESSYQKWLRILPKDKLRLSSRKIGKIMKIIRIKNNISIISLALIMDVDRNTITKYENGKRLPSLEYFYRFCVIFNLTMDELLKNRIIAYNNIHI